MFSVQLKKLRANRLISQKDLAKQMQVSQATIAGWEIGRSTPSPDNIIKLAQILEVSIDELLTDNTQANTNQPKDLVKFLNQAEVMFDGDTYKLNDDDRKKIRAALELAFWDAKERNKRKEEK